MNCMTNIPASRHDEAAKTLGRRELNRMATTEKIVNACLDPAPAIQWEDVPGDAATERAGTSRPRFYTYSTPLPEAVH